MEKTKRYKWTVLFILLGLFLNSCNNENSKGYQIQKGDFVQTITETGELAAVNAKTFVMPRYGKYWYELKIIGLLEHGASVQPGDSLIQFDPSEIKKFVIDRENDLETQKANLEKIIVQISNQESDLQSSLRSEQASFDLKKLEMEQFRFESDKIKKIKELEFEQAKIRLNKVQRSVELYKIIAKNQLRIQKINVEQRIEDLKSAYAVLPELTVRTPIPGIFQVARKRRSHDLISVGDEIYIGNKLGDVPDLTWMKVNTVVNEADFMKIALGHKVNVRLDALPETIFEGEIAYISKLCRPIERDSRQKIFDVEVKIKVSDERLKPGMTVSCEYICAELEDVYYVPISCVEIIEKKHFIVPEKTMKKKEVKVGPSNNTHIVLLGDFTKGERLMPIEELSETQTN